VQLMSATNAHHNTKLKYPRGWLCEVVEKTEIGDRRA